MRTDPKIVDLATLEPVLETLRRAGKKIVHCHGVFDPLHIGHIRHFEQAKRFGDLLVVTVTPDRYVNKGPHRPVFSAGLRCEAIAALQCVDYVAVNEWPMAIETIRHLKPDFFVKGSEYIEASKDRTGAIPLERETVESVGGQMVFTADITFSASNLVNKHLSVFSREATEYLTEMSDRYTAADIIKYLENARDLKVLLIGESIIDEYFYCDTMGKSGKEPILAARFVNSERFMGGVLAVANQVAEFCDNVSVVTFLGSYDSHDDFIREHLNPKVNPIFLRMQDAPTILKRRMVERYPFQKLFELYVMNDDEGNQDHSDALCEQLHELLPDFDVVIVTDYGHGMVSPEAVKLLSEEARFLAVNTQMNAANRGFNTISKYPRADYVCISENEMRLDARSRRRKIEDIVRDASYHLGCASVMVTQGKNGALCFSDKDGFVTVPALTANIVDRVGAGDAVLAVTSLCAAQAAPMEVLGMIGNAVGAQAVATVANREPVERVALFRNIECLMK